LTVEKGGLKQKEIFTSNSDNPGGVPPFVNTHPLFLFRSKYINCSSASDISLPIICERSRVDRRDLTPISPPSSTPKVSQSASIIHIACSEHHIGKPLRSHGELLKTFELQQLSAVRRAASGFQTDPLLFPAPAAR
jgi:hypothetical protein